MNSIGSHQQYKDVGILYTEEEMEYVCDYIDWMHMSKLENDYLDQIYHMSLQKHYDEYIPLKGPNTDIDSRYLRSLDILEMNRDMEAYEEDFRTHQLFASIPWEDRYDIYKSNTYHSFLNKKSEIVIPVHISKRGDKYSTGSTEYGKVYIPNNFIHDDSSSPIILRIRFQGFDGCRKTALPWRAISAPDGWVGHTDPFNYIIPSLL